MEGQLSLWDLDTEALMQAVKDGCEVLVLADEPFSRYQAWRITKGT